MKSPDIRGLSRHEAAHAVTLLQSDYGDMLKAVVFDYDGAHNIVPGRGIPLDVRAKMYVAGAAADGATFKTFSTDSTYEDDYEAFCLCVRNPTHREDAFLEARRLVREILRTPGYEVVADLLEKTCRKACSGLQVNPTRTYQISGAKLRKAWKSAQ